jgi:hypothetical protein
MEIVCEHG